MNNKKYVLRSERIRKWVAGRRGRMSVLANLVNKNRTALYKLIHADKMAPDLIEAIERRQVEIEALERECIVYFPFFKRFVLKGEGRVAKLAQKLKTSSEVLRGLARSKGDGRYNLLKYGLSNIKAAIKECEQERKDSAYSLEKIDVKAYVSQKIKKADHSLNDLMNLVNLVKENADFGNHDAAVIARQVGDDRYRVISIGFDTVFSDMCRSHVCEKSNPHLHAAMFAAINMPRNRKDEIGDLVLLSHTAPCPNCAPRLINTGITQAYCFYEPELMGGLSMLARQGVPVTKINLYDKTHRLLNTVNDQAAA